MLSREPLSLLEPYFDELAFAALAARSENVGSAQVNKLIEYLESTDSFTLLVFLVRQIARKEWRQNSGARLFRVLRELIANVGDERERKDILRGALGYFKWFYECGDINYRIMQSLKQQYRDLDMLLKDPRQKAPQGFAESYLRALLGV